ncbi:hypothetical protein RB195_008908 [Necator americanus]|uniref:Uncharacterized protein n=1 Tax=Necator americanus TaxID=51031 RepID=A0ABR1CRQ2_NECAM
MTSSLFKKISAANAPALTVSLAHDTRRIVGVRRRDKATACIKVVYAYGKQLNMKSAIFLFVAFIVAVAIAKPNPRIHSDSSSEEGPKHKPHHNHHGHHHRRSSPKPPTTVVSPTAPEKSDGTTPFADLTTTTDEIVVTDVSTDVVTSEQVTASDDSSVATLEPMDNRAFAVHSEQGSRVNDDKHHRRHHRHHHRHSSPQPRTTAASSSSTEAPEGTTQVADDTSPVTEIVVTDAVTEEVTAEQPVAPSGISDVTVEVLVVRSN